MGALGGAAAGPATTEVHRRLLREARIAGLMYLAIIAFGFYGEMVVRAALVVNGDPAATAARIAASPMLWRSGIVGDLLMHVLDVPVIVILYRLLRPAGPGLALLATGLNIVQTSVLATIKLTLVLPLLLACGAPSLQSIPPDQLHALGYLAISLHNHGFAIGLVFFGCVCLVRGQLIVRSGYLPAWLGWLIQLAGVGYLLNSLALLLVPSLTSVTFVLMGLTALVGEGALSIWLVVKGVDAAVWQQRARRLEPG